MSQVRSGQVKSSLCYQNKELEGQRRKEAIDLNIFIHRIKVIN